MTAETLISSLLRVHLVASAAILLVLLLRPLASRWCGARITYWLWLIVPFAAIAGALPAEVRVVVVEPLISAPLLSQGSMDSSLAQAVNTFTVSEADVLVAVWLLGFILLLGWSIVRTRLEAASPSVGPALVGVLRPRLVLPADFETRFNAEERALILAHEEMHLSSRHSIVNALVEVLRCAGWFNPLLHVAATRCRADQELACDAAVIAARPAARRVYAEALLKAQFDRVYVPLGCVWTSPSARRLGERIARLADKAPNRRRRIAGVAAIFGVGVASGYAAWAQQPPQIITVPAASRAVIPVAAAAAASQVQPAQVQPPAAPIRPPAAGAGQPTPSVSAATPPRQELHATELQIVGNLEATANPEDTTAYSGERISANFQNVPVRTLLQLIADTGGKSIAMSNSVSGNVVVTLDNVPWDHALDMVLKTRDLDQRMVDGAILISPRAELERMDAMTMDAIVERARAEREANRASLQ